MHEHLAPLEEAAAFAIAMEMGHIELLSFMAGFLVKEIARPPSSRQNWSKSA
jgi:hypothetical protein